jgi:hypothetical protein
MKSSKSNTEFSVATNNVFDASCYDILDNVHSLSEQLKGMCKRDETSKYQSRIGWDEPGESGSDGGSDE